MKIDMSKQYATKNGHPVRIYATDGSLGGVHGAFLTETGWHHHTWSALGHAYPPCEVDLVEVKPRVRRTVWLNVYGPEKGSEVCAHATRECAARIDNDYAASRLACIKVEIDCLEGEGLS